MFLKQFYLFHKNAFQSTVFVQHDVYEYEWLNYEPILGRFHSDRLNSKTEETCSRK